MAQNDIEDMLDDLRRMKSRGHDLDSINIKTLEMDLRFLTTFLKYHHVLLPDSFVKITKKAQLIDEMLQSVSDECKTNLNVERLVSQLLEFIEGNTNLRYNYELNDSHLSEYMDCLDKNLNDVQMLLELDTKWTNKRFLQLNRFLEQVKIIQKKMRFLRYLYATEITSYIDHDKLEGLETRIQFMADNVGQFCLALWLDKVKDYAESNDVKDDAESDDVKDGAESDDVKDDAESDDVKDGAESDDVKDGAESDDVKDDADSDEDKDDIDADEDSDEDKDDIDADEDSDEDKDDIDADEDTDEDKDDIDADEDTDDIYSYEDEDIPEPDEVEDNADSDEDENDFVSKPPYLLCLIKLVELEMKKTFLGEIRASKFCQSRAFKKQKFPKDFSQQLHSLLVCLKCKKLKNFSDTIFVRNINVPIEFLLVFLADVPNHVINGKKLNEVLEEVGALVGDVLCVIHSSMIKDDTSKINHCLMQILEKTENLKAQLESYHKSLKFSLSQFPTVGGLSFLDSLLRKLNEMMKSELGLNFMMKPQIVILEKEFSYLTSVFRDVAKVQHKHEIHKDLINLAYEAEVAIDSILAQSNALWYLFCSLPTILKEIKHISEELTTIWSENLALKPCSMVEPSKHSNLMNDEEIVGFENDTERIIQYLTQGKNELDIIPIVGMGGQGKTTCARKMYNNNIIGYHFDVRAWCFISQTYSRRELLQEIFNQVTGSKDKVDEVGELAHKLKKSLIQKRYLIVLDDMWDFMAWDDLRLCFPDVVNRSRIVVTTRLEKVGEHVKCHTDLYFLPSLTPEESRELLQKKVFQNEACPPELHDVSLDVARRCQGLPLVVVLAAGIIKKKKMEISWWHEVKTALFSYLDRESEDMGRATMQLSYDNLPDYLRPCLLYMGMFPEDKRIPVSKLISLWIAEGFVQNIESGRLMEETAEGYLMDLINSNVVMVSKRRYDGKVKYCRVHDIVLHFCLERSREEKFMLAVRGNIQPSDLKESRVSFSFSNELSMFASKMQKPFHQHLRSLITTNEGKSLYWNSLGRAINLMRLLKVLDLGSHILGQLSLATLKPLIHLKYVALSIDTLGFRGKSHLPHLETLIVTCSNYTRLSGNFFKMKKLRHVEFTDSDFYWGKQINEESSKLENLRILRGVTLYLDADCLNVLVQRCPNLQELKIFFLRNNSDEEKICLNLESLTQLQSLNLCFSLSDALPKLHLPSNVKTLLLYGPRIESTIFFIAELPNVEYLDLRNSVRTDYGEWCLGDITFHKLKLLKLMNLGISKWDASEECFPELETLVLTRFRYLEEIPRSFADIPTLQQIKLLQCSNNKSLVASALRIKEEVKENEGCDRIHLIIDAQLWKL